MNNPKNHHYIPQSYQLLFSENDSGKLCLYDKENSKFIEGQSPRNFCAENFLYSLSGVAEKELSSSTYIENPFLSTIDGQFVEEVKKIVSENIDKTNVSTFNMARFFGYLSCRHPLVISEYEENLNKSIIQGLVEHAKSKPEFIMKAKELEIDLDNPQAFEGLEFSETRNFSLMKMLEQSEKNAEHIHESMGWKFLFAKQSEFILSDSPFIVFSEDFELNNLFKNSQFYRILIPLSKEVCVAFSPTKKPISHEYLGAEEVLVLNRLIFENAVRWIIGSSKKVLNVTIR